MSFKPFSDDQLQALEDRFGAIEVYTPDPRPRPRWSKAPLDAPLDPPFSLVFRAALSFEWEMSQKQVSNEKLRHSAPRNLAMTTIVAVSVDGAHMLHGGAEDRDVPANDRGASKAPQDAFKALLARPGNAGVAEDVADLLARLNGLHASEAEKG